MATKRQWEDRIQQGPDAWPPVLDALRTGSEKQARMLVPLLLADAWGPEVMTAVVEALPRLSPTMRASVVEQLVMVPDDELRPAIEALAASGDPDPAHHELLARVPALRDALFGDEARPETVDAALAELARHSLPEALDEVVQWAAFAPLEAFFERPLDSIYVIAAVEKRLARSALDDEHAWAFRALRAHAGFDPRPIEPADRAVDRLLLGAGQHASEAGRSQIEPVDLAMELCRPSTMPSALVLRTLSHATCQVLDLAEVGGSLTRASILHALTRIGGSAADLLASLDQRPEPALQGHRDDRADDLLACDDPAALFQVAYARRLPPVDPEHEEALERALTTITCIARAHLHEPNVDEEGAVDRSLPSLRSMWRAAGAPVGLQEVLDLAHDVQRRRCHRWLEHRTVAALADAFESLRSQGIASCIACETTQAYARVEVRHRWQGTEPPRGSAFTVSADTLGAVAGAGLLVYFSVDENDPTAVPRAIVSALEEQGLPVRWQGDLATAITVLPCAWEKVRPSPG